MSGAARVARALQDVPGSRPGGIRPDAAVPIGPSGSAPSPGRPASDLRRVPAPPNVEDLDALGVLRVAFERLGTERIAVVNSLGAEGVVVLDLISRLGIRPRVLTLDTGRLPAETLELLERVEARYGLAIEVVRPDPAAVEAMVRERGLDLFYRSVEDRLRCCEVRKVEPLRRALAGFAGWVTGIRREQTRTRARAPKIGLDLEHGLIWKIAPLADWTEDEVWAYIRANDVPYNRLHDLGYRSIGCAPCTRPVGPGEDPRAGRWWWETSDTRECGLHVDPATLLAAEGGR